MIKLLPFKNIHVFFLLVFICCMNLQAMAQEQVGIIAGGSIVTTASRSTQGTTTSGGNLRLRYHGGLSYFSSDESQSFGFRTLLLYSNKGEGVGNRSRGRSDAHLHYINLALELAYEVLDDTYLYAGIEPGVLVNAQRTFDYSNNPNTTRGEGKINITDRYNFYDLSLSIGAEYRFQSGLFASFRYVHGIVNIMNNNDDTNSATSSAGRFAQTRTTNVSLGYYF